jgi:hypothetical protein
MGGQRFGRVERSSPPCRKSPPDLRAALSYTGVGLGEGFRTQHFIWEEIPGKGEEVVVKGTISLRIPLGAAEAYAPAGTVGSKRSKPLCHPTGA